MFKWNSAVDIHLHERMKMPNQKQYRIFKSVSACQVLAVFKFWCPSFLPSHWKRRGGRKTEDGFRALCLHMSKLLWKEMRKMCWIFTAVLPRLKDKAGQKDAHWKKQRIPLFLLKYIFAVYQKLSKEHLKVVSVPFASQPSVANCSSYETKRRLG